jgi:hypothetical protein
MLFVQSELKVTTRYYIDTTPEQLRQIANLLESAQSNALKGQELVLEVSPLFAIRCQADSNAAKRPAPTKVTLTTTGAIIPAAESQQSI